MLYVGLFVLGFVVGIVITTCIMLRKKTVGSIIVKHDEDGSYLFLAFNKDEDPNTILRRKRVILNVDLNNHDSQK